MNQLEQLAQRFPDKFIHDNPSGFGDYIQHSVIRQRLLSVLGAYSTKIVETIYDEGGNVLTVSKNDNLIKLANVLVTGLGIYSFYYGFHKKNLFIFY